MRQASRFTRSVVATAVVALGVPLLAAAPAPADPAATSSFSVLTINDFHGRLEADDPAAGAAVLAGAVHAFEATGETLVVSAGDSIGASTFTSFIQNDQPTLDALNSIGLDASALGNHEFDTGTADLRDRILPAASFPYLAANVYTAGTTDPAFDEYSLSTVGQPGQSQTTVGFIGAVTEELPSLVSPSGIADIEVGEIVPAVNRVAEQLSDGDAANGEADVLILLVHEGAASPDPAAATDASAFGRVVTGVDDAVDAIVSAHTHQTYNHQLPIPSTDRTRPVIQAGQYGEALGHLTVTVDAAGDLVDIASEVVPLYGAYPPDPAVEAIVADAVAVAEVEGAVPVGRITDDLTRAVQSDGVTENRGGESTLGNFVADVQQAATADIGSQFALMNPGGLRADLTYASGSPDDPASADPDGTVTYREAASVQPFANTLVTLTLTGEQLRRVLDEQWQPAAASRPFLKLGVSRQLQYSYDPTAPAGQRIGTILLEGKPVADTDSLRATVNSFLASGGDNFTTLAEGTDRADSGRIDLQSMVGYFATAGDVSPDTAQRAVGVTLTPPAPYSGGQQLTVALSSLLLSTDEPTGDPSDGTVVVSVDAGDDSAEPTSVPIDRTIIDTTDESGRATATVTVPNEIAGGASLLIAVPTTGTSLTIPLPLAEPVKPLPVVTPPAIHGAPRVGKELTAAEAVFGVDDAVLRYQWTRNGQPIDGALAVTYRVQPADSGTDIAVVVTASAPGYGDAVATSPAKTIRRLGSTTNASPDRLIVPTTDEVVFSVRVEGDDAVVPVGDIVIYDGGWEIASATLTEADAGQVAVTLPELGRGVHLLTARFAGNDELRASTSWPAAVVAY
jgi:5'-nucleotidase